MQNVIKQNFANIIKVSLMGLLLIFSTMTYATSSTAEGPHIQVALVSENQYLQIGENWLGIYLQPEDHWHTYWRNPGDSGEAPSIEWTLPDGVKSGQIQWPLPQEIPVAHLVNYGYDGENLLMVPITISKQYASKNSHLRIIADLSWLVCKEDCIPGWATLSLHIPLSDKIIPSENKGLFEDTRALLPSTIKLEAKHEISAQNIVVSIAPPTESQWRLMPFTSDVIQHSGDQQLIKTTEGTSIVLPSSDYFSQSSKYIDFLMTDGKQGFYVSSELNQASQGDSPSNEQSILLLALMAFAGGLILNLMPCVLPILSIKALGMQQTNSNILTKSAYFMGVLTCFMAFALLIILLKESGTAVGWGFHMQEPWVIALLAYLFTFIALTLMDIAPSGSRLAGLGQSLIQGQGVFSQFTTGILAVIVASPCTAPFMAAALGVAMVSSTGVTLILFASLAVGFALPLTLLFALPSLTNKLPKPGPWMVTFRQFLAFPILGTVIWLVWVFLQQTNAFIQLGLLTGLLVFSLFLWLGSVSPSKAKWFYLLATLSIVPIVFKTLDNQPTVKTSAVNAFSQTRLQTLKDKDQVVLVNMTADWCITCKVNEQIAFTSDDFDQAISHEKVHYLVGDWTNKNAEILDYLNQYQRSGVPLYVVYAGNDSYKVLPQILTTEIVVDAINNALGEIENEN